MGARFWLEISWLFFRKVVNVAKKVKNSLKNAKKMKNCPKVAEQLVAKPTAKLCLTEKALSFKWRYDRCGCHSNLSNCKLSSTPPPPKNNNNNNNNGFSTRFKHMASVLALNYSTNWERRPIHWQQDNLRPCRSPRLSVPQFSKGKAMRTKLPSLLSSS